MRAFSCVHPPLMLKLSYEIVTYKDFEKMIECASGIVGKKRILPHNITGSNPGTKEENKMSKKYTKWIFIPAMVVLLSVSMIGCAGKQADTGNQSGETGAVTSPVETASTVSAPASVATTAVIPPTASTPATATTTVLPTTASSADVPTTGQQAKQPESTTAATGSNNPVGTAILPASLSIPIAEYPRIDGSTATIPLSVALIQTITGISVEEAEMRIQHTRTSESFLFLMDGYTDLLLVYNPPAATYEAIESAKVALEMVPIGRDALVFLTNEKNPVQSLTEEQIVAIYSGKIKNWREVGGEDMTIAAFQRNESSGSQALMRKLVMKDEPMAEAPKELVPGEMGMLIDSLAAYNNNRNALGYSVYYYVNNMFSADGIRTMAVNDIPCTNETIRDNRYPFTEDFFAVIRKDEPADSNTRKLFDWITGPEGGRLIENTGYTALR